MLRTLNLAISELVSVPECSWKHFELNIQNFESTLPEKQIIKFHL